MMLSELLGYWLCAIHTSASCRCLRHPTPIVGQPSATALPAQWDEHPGRSISAYHCVRAPDSVASPRRVGCDTIDATERNWLCAEKSSGLAQLRYNERVMGMTGFDGLSWSPMASRAAPIPLTQRNLQVPTALTRLSRSRPNPAALSPACPRGRPLAVSLSGDTQVSVI